MNPAVSIIVPVYNVEDYLEPCIESILQQTFTDFELILVNDGSTDGSADICDRYAYADERVRVFHKDYGGVSSARNIGICRAKGDFIGFVDSDDRIDRNMYQILYRHCLDSGSDIAVCKLGREIDGKLINATDHDLVLEMNNQTAMKEMFKGHLYRFSLCNKLFKRKCFANIQFPEGRIHEDLSTTYKLFAQAQKVIFTSYIGYIYIKRENSILTKTYDMRRLDSFKGWDEILSFMAQYYPVLTEEVSACFVYWCLDNINYIIDQVSNKKERDICFRQIQQYMKKYQKNILKNSTLSFRSKWMITIMNYNFRLFLVALYIKRILKEVT